MTSTGRRVAFFAVAIASGAILAGGGRAADVAAVDISPVEDAVVCTCGCPHLVLSSCFCGRADEMRAEITGLYKGGMGEEEVLRTLVDRYGERVLAAPKQEGFNLTAYTMPFLVILLGGGLVIALIGRWKKNAVAGVDPPPPSAGLSEDDPYRKRLEQELASHED